MREPRTKLEWCEDCGERYTLHKMDLTAGGRRHVLYQAEPHYCPMTCRHCGIVYSRVRRGLTVTDDPHHCPGSDEAAERGRALMRKQVNELNRIMARALRRA